MAVNIDTVYQKVLAFANKEQRGYITPQEFNLYADQAQKEIFEQYFYDLKQLARVSGNSEEYSDIVHNVNEKISIFEGTGTVVGSSLVPDVVMVSDMYRLGTVIFQNKEVEEVQQNEILYLQQSPLAKPTATRPVYVRASETTISIYPATITAGITFTFIRKPSKPSWGYFVVGNKALHDSSLTKTTHFEVHPAEESELVYKILKFAGISMKRDDVVRSGVTMESMQAQQEKQ